MADTRHSGNFQHSFRHSFRHNFRYGILTSLLGTLNHFLYDWSGRSSFFALFCPVNESLWEHLKLLFFPFFFVSLAGLLRWKLMHRNSSGFRYTRYWYTRLLAVLVGLFGIIVLFNTYTGILGRHYLIMDLAIYYFSVFFCFALNSCFQQTISQVPPKNLVYSLWILVALCFFTFTCSPPNLPLFFPPA